MEPNLMVLLCDLLLSYESDSVMAELNSIENVLGLPIEKSDSKNAAGVSNLIEPESNRFLGPHSDREALSFQRQNSVFLPLPSSSDGLPIKVAKKRTASEMGDDNIDNRFHHPEHGLTPPQSNLMTLTETSRGFTSTDANQHIISANESDDDLQIPLNVNTKIPRLDTAELSDTAKSSMEPLQQPLDSENVLSESTSSFDPSVDSWRESCIGPDVSRSDEMDVESHHSRPHSDHIIRDLQHRPQFARDTEYYPFGDGTTGASDESDFETDPLLEPISSVNGFRFRRGDAVHDSLRSRFNSAPKESGYRRTDINRDENDIDHWHVHGLHDDQTMSQWPQLATTPEPSGFGFTSMDFNQHIGSAQELPDSFVRHFDVARSEPSVGTDVFLDSVENVAQFFDNTMIMPNAPGDVRSGRKSH